ncbi:GIDE domain-containing protein [Streptomyces sulphureus]|uniref:GIDE domain-containing protein n=1 Tax=Streptomyces sulphureus TaxID=47758 RepID=UPI0003809554|nr:GIDE domain-containing protein [Streptomyces sulphureus]
MLWVGLFAVAVAVVCGYFAKRADVRTGALERVETLAVKDVKALHEAAAEAAGPGHFRQPCEVVGSARAHKDGVLRSELSEVECVWHRHRITRRYEETYRDSNGNRRRRTRNDVVSDHSSPTAFFVEDATGRMVVRPGDKQVDRAEKILDTFEPHTGRGNRITIGPVSVGLGGGGTIGFRKEEWVVRPGVRLFVHGEAADASGRLSLGEPAESGVFLMSTRTQAELVRSGNRKVMGFGIGTGVAGIAGVALVVLGLVL